MSGALEPGGLVLTDGWSAYPRATRDRYQHTGTSGCLRAAGA
jgi:hypothetical protein